MPGIVGCCARAASGHTATEPAITLMKSRRRTDHPRGKDERHLWLEDSRSPNCSQGLWPRGGPLWVRSGHRRLFDHLVGNGEHAGRNAQAECLGGLEVNDQLELGRLRDRKVGWLFALENSASINAGLAPGIGPARSVTHQTTNCNELARLIDHREPLPWCPRHDLVGPPGEKLG